MEKEDAMVALYALVGQDLRQVAEQHEITVWTDKGKMNKGWAGHAVERYLGLPLNSAQCPNLGTWELKVVPLVTLADGQLRPKETMAITKIDEVEVDQNGFFESYLYTKIRRLILVTRHRVDGTESSSPVLGVHEFQLDKSPLLQAIRNDYEDIRNIIRVAGIDELHSTVGKYVQARTKGAGHGSKTRAFYAKKELINEIIQSQRGAKRTRRRRIPDCSEHAGVTNSANRESLDMIMIRMPANQSGAGRHKCVYCAYQAGYADALAELGR